MYKLRTCIALCLCLLLFIKSSADSLKATKDEEALVAMVDRFFSDWLVRRDLKKLPLYLVEKPILGECVDLGLGSKEMKSFSEKQLIIMSFQQILKNLPKKKSLAEVFVPTERLSVEDSNTIQLSFSKRSLYQIYKMKSSDVSYICKFDERPSFRSKVGQSDVYYVHSEWNEPSNKGVILQTLWVKESGKWKLLTLASLEN